MKRLVRVFFLSLAQYTYFVCHIRKLSGLFVVDVESVGLRADRQLFMVWSSDSGVNLVNWLIEVFLIIFVLYVFFTVTSSLSQEE